MVLFVHNRYRTAGGEERVVEDLLRLVPECLDERAELLERRSEDLDRWRAARGLLRGGLEEQEVGDAVLALDARVVHAHNLLPAFGWRALAAARAQGARVVLHLHQYRLVCAVGVCFTHGAECTRCHGRNTLPGLRLNCRGSVPEAAAYATALSRWQARLIAQADAFIVPSAFARERLRALGAPLPWDRVHVLAPPLFGPDGDLEPPSSGLGGRRYALLVSRLAQEKGVDVAIAACERSGIDLLVAGDGPERPRLEELAAAARTRVRLLGRVSDRELARLRAGAAIALAPSRSGETFGIALAEAMLAGVPAAASRVGALGELLEPDQLVDPDDVGALAEAIERLAGDRAVGERGRERVRAICSPAAVAAALAEIYGP